MKTKIFFVLVSVLTCMLNFAALAQEVQTAEFYTGSNSGWYKIATFDLSTVGGCCGHANVEAEINYANTSYTYNINASIRFRINKSSSQDAADWRYNIDGADGDLIKLKRLSTYLYEIWGNSKTAFGYFSTELRIAKEGTITTTTHSTPISVTDTGQQDVTTKGDWYFPVGTVNIGHTDYVAGHALSVKGSILSEEVVVKTYTTWPDYVFEESYPLTPLRDLETYLKVNKHLPGIPDAKTVEEEGVKLGEMNAKLLEKVEELTLYIIQQQKLIEQQNKKMEEQEKRIQKLEQE